MKKTKLYFIIIIVLVIINLVQVAIPVFLHKGPPPRNHEERFDGNSILHLTGNQNSQFNDMAVKHHDKMMEIQNQQKVLTEQYFAKPTAKLLNEICMLENAKISYTNSHFEEVKSILTKEQLPYYQDFKNKAVNIIIN